MSISKKHSLLILLAFIILIAVPMSFAADADNNTAADVIGIDDSSDSIQTVDDSNVLEEEGGEGYIEFENTTIEINEGETATINGLLYYYEDAVSYDDVNFNYSYVDYDGNTQSNQVTHHVDYSSDYGMSVDITGLKAREDPYLVTFTPIHDDDYDTYCMYSGGMDPSKSTSVSILVKALAPSYDYETNVAPSSVDYVKGTSSNVTVTAICGDLGDLEEGVTEWQVYINGASTGTKIGVDAMVKEFVFDLATISDDLNTGVNTVVFHPNQGTLESWCYFDTFNYNPLTVTVAEPPAVGNASYVQELINNASVGDIIDLSAYDVYDFGYVNDVTIATDNVVLKGNGRTTILTNGGSASNKGQAILVTASNVTITGINFVDTNPNNNFVYGGSVNGWGVQFDGSNDAQGGLVENCTFKDFNQAVVVTGFDHLTVRNCNFTGGYSTLLMNDPSVNKEAGSKVISVGGSFFTTIENNYFEGPVLDAISIAKASGDAKIIGNTFVNNVYAIFFGGASTEGTHIDNNVFINCGSFFEGNISWYAFPVISLEKAANGVSVDGNTFYAMNRNMLIKAEQGNTAHGAASTFGDFNVTNNKVIASPDETNFIGESVTLFHINCKNSILNPFTNIYANGNELATGVRAVVVWSTEWGTEMVYYGKSANNVSDNVIPKADPQVTKFNDVFVASNGTIAGTLTDNNNKGVANAIISYLIDGVVANVTADKNGAFAFDAAKGKTVLISFAATDKYAAASFTTNTPEEQPAPVDIDTVTTVTDVTVLAGDSAVLTVTVTANGTAVDNQTVSVKVDNTVKTLTVVNGTAKMNVKYTSAGTHYVTAIFSGDGYKTSVGSSVIKVNKKATAITASAATLKAKVAKKITVVLKSGTKAVAGKKVTITVNGKTYSGKTLSNGKAVISVKVLKAGKFYAIVKFAGDGAYTASSKKVLYTVK